MAEKEIKSDAVEVSRGEKEMKMNHVVHVKAAPSGITMEILIENDEHKEILRKVLDILGENDKYLISDQYIYADKNDFLNNL